MRFKKSFCTNTRLMGTLMLAIEWINDVEDEIYHVFMLDDEGLGISDFYPLENISREEKELFYKKKYGGLGGSKIALDEEEAIFMVNCYLEKNEYYNKPVPENLKEEDLEIYKKNKNENISIYNLMDKIYKEIDTENEFVNYMVMRFIARDKKALLYFSGSEEVANQHITKINGALLYNEIEKKSEDRFICNCVYEDIDGYYEGKIVVNIEKFELEDDGLAYDDAYDFRLRSIFIISTNAIYDFEVFDIISKREVLDIYKLNSETKIDDLEKLIFNTYPMIQKVKYENGNLYTQYFFDNSHVDRDIYVINNDIMFNIYVNENNMFLATYDLESRNFIESTVQSFIPKFIEKEHVYEFEQNVLFDFIESGNDDFYDFIDE
ncbi:hypothetical protein [Peptostreptococcus faecalis]|uniref:hypothetical protein n=1 Tax=Peptostreptococcus faecalis TaxID=2045015 RepID=UPI000C7BFB3B|nr:hypothetical protein [Peptostreptococcus faecalis]